MQGIQSLMPQGQGPMQGPVPGQAPQQPMPGMMPKPGAATPSAMVGPLSQMHMQQLVQMMMNPRPDGPPLYAVLTAINEQQKKAQAQAAVQRQMAMSQGQQAAPPVAAQVMQAAEQMQEPVMAAYGGEMQGYAGGGAVAFTNGAGPNGLPQQNPEEEDLSDDPRLSFAERRIRSQKRAELARQQGIGRSFAERYPREADIPAADTGDELARMLSRAPAPVPMAMRDTRGVTPETVAAARQLGSGQGAPVQRPQAGPAPVQNTTANPTDLSPEMVKAYADREAQMRGRLVRPESLVAAEQGLAALAKSNIEAQQAEAKTYSEEIRAARDAALARSQRDILSDPMSLLALAGSIDTRRGQGIGSLARGAAGLMGKREEQAEAARKEFTQAQRDERSMQANIRQTQMLEAQRQVALEQGKLGEVNAINDKLSELAIKREEFRLTRGDVAFQQTMEGRKVTADERRARADEIRAGKPDATVQLLQALFPGQPPSVENLAKVAAAQYGPRLGAREMTYDQASDNVQKLLDSTSGIMEVNAIKKKAKEAGQPEPSILEIKEMLIQRELRGAAARSGAPSAAPSATTTTAPAVGTIMQGYRFKGGNPADQNNWEKV